MALALTLVAVCCFVVCLADGECYGAECSSVSLGAGLLQVAGQVSRISQQSLEEQNTLSPRAKLVRSLADHWVRVVEENVVPDAEKVSCERLPAESLEYFR